ncbi:Caffeoylshikimate esterase-like protein [Drosera capensis]
MDHSAPTFRPILPRRAPNFPTTHFRSNPTGNRIRSAAEVHQKGILRVMSNSKKLKLEGVSDRLRKIAASNLDFAPARRTVRSAFVDIQLQLDHCLFKWYEVNSNGLEIFCKSWLPKEDERTKAVVCFCHGYGDTCTFFFEGIARIIAASGYAVFAVDHPGFGLSDGLHGYISSFDGLADNAIEQYTKIKGRRKLRGLPFFLFGQSMGGAVAIKVILSEPHQWDDISDIEYAAKIAEEVMPPEPLLRVGYVLSSVIPKVKFFQQADLAELAFRDPVERKMTEYNVICYSGQVRLKTAMELLKATSDIESQVEKIHSPLLILHGAADRITDPIVSRFLYEKASSKDKTLKLYEGAYHSILEGEPDDRIFAIFDDIISWLDSRCSTT